jgi:hypothetical protein
MASLRLFGCSGQMTSVLRDVLRYAPRDRRDAVERSESARLIASLVRVVSAVGLAEALAHNTLDRAAAARFFDGLSYSTKQRFVLSIEEAKTAETRQRCIEKAVSMLREGRSER